MEQAKDHDVDDDKGDILVDPADLALYPANVNVIVKHDSTQKSLAKLLSTDLAVEHILKYLDYTSMKLLSATCRTLKRIIRESHLSSQFLDRTKVNLIPPCQRRGTKTKRVDFSSFQFQFPCKNLSVEVNGWTDDEYQVLLSLLPKVETLEIHRRRDVAVAINVNDVLLILSEAVSLKQLIISTGLMDIIIHLVFLRDLAGNPNVKANLERLESLDIISGVGNDFEKGEICYSLFDPLEIFISTLSTLGTTPHHLTSFVVKNIFAPETDDLTRLGDTVKEILNANKLTMKRMRLEGNFVGAVIQEMVFPSLKEISLADTADNLTAFAAFLLKQSPLESLELKFSGKTVSGLPLLNALRLHGPHLKSFSLTWKLVNPTPLYRVADVPLHVDALQMFQVARGLLPPGVVPVPAQETWDFSFLKDFKSLRELFIQQNTGEAHSLSFSQTVTVSAGSILSSIPDDASVIKLCGAVSGNWTGDSPPVTMESLGRFKNLSILDLVQCASVLDDQILTFICMEMPQLLELGFSHCGDLTDAGVTGNQKDGSGIRAITGLRKLRILCCPQLTEYGLLSSITFRDLKHLTLVFSQAINYEFYMKIGAQNKSLEILVAGSIIRPESGTEDDDHDDTFFMEAAELTELLKQQSEIFRMVHHMAPPPANPGTDSDDEQMGDGDSDFSGMDDDRYVDDFGFSDEYGEEGYSDDDD